MGLCFSRVLTYLYLDAWLKCNEKGSAGKIAFKLNCNADGVITVHDVFSGNEVNHADLRTFNCYIGCTTQLIGVDLDQELDRFSTTCTENGNIHKPSPFEIETGYYTSDGLEGTKRDKAGCTSHVCDALEPYGFKGGKLKGNQLIQIWKRDFD